MPTEEKKETRGTKKVRKAGKKQRRGKISSPANQNRKRRAAAA